MSIETTVLRAMLRLSRRREPADEEALTVRSGATGAQVRDILRRLEASGWVERRPGLPARLTFAGLALAVALLPRASTRRQVRRPRRASRAA